MVTFTGDDGRALVSHSSHHHPLKLVATGGALFQCDGCRQLGDELRYRCDQCDFDLHVCCAQAREVFEHPMFEGRALTFFHSRPGSLAGYAGCDVCGDPVLGFLYHNREHDLDLHPFCAILPERMVLKDEGFVLNLQKASGHSCGLCGEVGRRGRYLSYRLQDDDGKLVSFHVACVMEMNYSTDGHVVQASSPASEEVSATTAGELALLQNAPVDRRSGKFRRFCKVAFRVARVSYSVATLDPVGLVTAIASPI